MISPIGPWSISISLRCMPSVCFSRTVLSSTRGPAKPINALGSATITSPRSARLADTPPTLNMSISGMRDLSIIATPPARRLSVRTFVMEQQNTVIKEALLRELLRGGQVYYLHNDVKTIEKCAADLQALVPEARVAIGR